MTLPGSADIIKAMNARERAMAQCSAERMAAVIKLIVSDFDGTVLPYGQKAVSAAWRSAFSSAMEEGVLFAISSGRTYGELLSFLPDDE